MPALDREQNGKHGNRAGEEQRHAWRPLVTPFDMVEIAHPGRFGEETNYDVWSHDPTG